MFKDGIEQNEKNRRAAADSLAAADAAKKAGIMGKAKNVFGGKDRAGTAGGAAPLAANGIGECFLECAEGQSRAHGVGGICAGMWCRHAVAWQGADLGANGPSVDARQRGWVC